MQWVINGAIDGILIGLLAVAFMLVYSTTSVFFVALGGVYALAPFVTLSALRFGLHPAIAIPLGALASASLSILLELFNHRRLEQRRSSTAAHLVSSLGLNIVIVQALSLFWGNKMQVLGEQTAGVGAQLGGIIIGKPQVLALTVVPAIVLALGFWARSGRTSLPLRALATNSQELALTGTNVGTVRLIVFGLSGLLAAVVSLVRAHDTGFDAVSGLNAVVLSFAALIVGGRKSFWGGVLGGVILGILRSGIAWFGSARWQEPVTFLVLASFLLFWPQGLLGASERAETLE